MKKALLIIDVQISAVTKPEIARRIENLQYDYDTVYVSKFTNTNSPLLPIMNWTGYDNEELAFIPKENAIIFTKTGYSSYLSEMKAFDEIHLCGFDTDACIYKTAMDLVENNIRPIILQDCCFGADRKFHEMGIKLIEHNIGKHNIK
ncbi:MAG: cysteine hydrolase [Alphaproteobacteria bacterium]|nr:cysteine hydrolase [Alphaproteobacteria bacterium]